MTKTEFKNELIGTKSKPSACSYDQKYPIILMIFIYILCDSLMILMIIFCAV